MWKCLVDLNVDPPAAVVRSHVHQYTHRIGIVVFGDKEYRAEIFVTPPMCGPNSFMHKATQSGIVLRFGMLLLNVDKGKVIESWPLYKTRDARTIHLSINGVVSTTYKRSKKTAAENDKII
jgi:hypothetical protein